ncbi:MAG: MFS transporter [Erysipelotrichaceae bacterium]|nr:MFS transporter [Erysipelotrichaceae bacterium]
MNKLRRKHIYVIIATSCLIGATLGLTTNVAGLYINSVCEYLNASRGQVSLTITICSVAFALAGMLVPRLLKEQNYRLFVASATVLTVVCTVCLSLAEKLWVFYLLNALRGFGAGLISSVPVTIMLNNWFVRNNGLITSLVLGFSGIIASLFSPVLAGVIEKYDWQKGYLFNAGAIALLCGLAWLLPVGLNPESVGEQAYGASEEKNSASKEQSDDEIDKIKYLLIVAFAVFCAMGTSFGQHLPGLASYYGLPESLGATLLSMAMLINTMGKLMLGAGIDRFGSRLTLICGCLICAVGYLLLMSGRVILLYGGALLMGLSYGLTIVGVVFLIRKCFGTRNYSRVYPSVSMLMMSFSAFSSSLVGFSYDLSGSYYLILSVMAVMLILSALIVMTVDRD